MKLFGELSPREQALLGIEQEVISADDAFHLLMTATQRLGHITEHLFELRGGAPGQKSELNNTWHDGQELGQLIKDLGRLSGADEK